MNRIFKYVSIFTFFLISFACSKKENIPLPTEAPPPPVIEKPAEPVQEEPEPMVTEVPEPTELEKLIANRNSFEAIHFDFDKADLRQDAQAVLRRHAEVIKANPGLKILIEGHCDERGTEEYNLALGERRASRVLEYLASLGVDAMIMRTISYGETQPLAMGANEEAWAENRRAQFLLSKQ